MGSLLGDSAAEYQELYRLKIENRPEGAISVRTSADREWQQIGRVVQPVLRVNERGYTASQWGGNSTVVASAVNAIHLKVRDFNEQGGVIFSILPRHIDSGKGLPYSSYSSPASSLQTDIKAGESIFGGKWSLLVGNPVFLQGEQELTPLPTDYSPVSGDVLVIKVLIPRNYPSAIIFENRYNGRVLLEYPGRKPLVVARVLKPVVGIGRFIGTKDTPPGRIRANHSGVIDISTSLLGRVGGFQIIPVEHSESPEMSNARLLTQWMIVGPVGFEDPALRGHAPLFSEVLQPRYLEELAATTQEWHQDLLSRTLVEVMYKGEEVWRPMPIHNVNPNKSLPRRYNTILTEVAKFRILLPIQSE